ncbi:MAG: 50S ribosomal protein L24 [Elusimicrobiota bacterium]|nr:50S ribosomal protein L24 [Endomicrobiia bacterium]MDW8165499.1 50S ribosomal protein L24 [Elusimicrobiota bacterium]
MRKIKKKDIVMVLSGKDKGKKGEVIKVIGNDKVIVSKVNIAKKHFRPTQNNPGGIREIEMPIHISKVKLICPKCSQPTRVGFKFLQTGEKVRYCKKCKEIIV